MNTTQRTHVVCSRVSAEALGTSCKDTMSLEPCYGFTFFTSCLFLHLPGDKNLTERLPNCWMSCSGVQAAVACKLGSRSEVSVAVTQHLHGPGKVLHSSVSAGTPMPSPFRWGNIQSVCCDSGSERGPWHWCCGFLGLF